MLCRPATHTTLSLTSYVSHSHHFSNNSPPMTCLLPQISYPLSVINAAISFGIIYLSIWPYDGWPSVSVIEQLTAAFFGAANVFLFVFPFVPPPADRQPYMRLPYWSHAVAAWVIFGVGFLYWLVWVHLLPRIGGYTLVQSEEVARDGLTRRKFKRTPLHVE